LTMREAQGMSAAEAPPAWPMLRAMVSVGLLCGLFIATAFLTTRPAIERNRAQALQRAIFEVLPAAHSSASFQFTEIAGFERVGSGDKPVGPVIHAGFGEDGQLVGLAVEAAGMGYQDVIRILYGYAPRDSAIVGMRVLESRETPGLGDRIETDAPFQANFHQLDVSLTADHSRIAHPIEAVKQGTKDAPWQIDGITGATISSVAVADILRKSSAEWIPRIQLRVEQFRREAVP
jgi:electron transport complex protein RnfG